MEWVSSAEDRREIRWPFVRKQTFPDIRPISQNLQRLTDPRGVICAGIKTGRKGVDPGANQESPREGPICTSPGCSTGGDVIGMGFSVCGARQLSSMPTCWTQETVHFAAQNLAV